MSVNFTSTTFLKIDEMGKHRETFFKASQKTIIKKAKSKPHTILGNMWLLNTNTTDI